jgi:hypothetical protein
MDYRAERFEERVQSMDAVFGTVGGDTLRRSWGVLRPGGRLVTIAASEEGSHDERTRAAFFIVEPRRAELEEVARLIDSGEVRPVVGAEFPWWMHCWRTGTSPPAGRSCCGWAMPGEGCRPGEAARGCGAANATHFFQSVIIRSLDGVALSHQACPHVGCYRASDSPAVPRLRLFD